MGPVRHSVISGVAAAVVYASTDSIAAAGLCLIAGILVDIDHILDYILNFGIKTLSLKAVYDVSVQTGASKGEQGMKRFYLVLHSVELLICLLALTLFFSHPLLIGATVGYGLHLLADLIGNPVVPQAYFICWRARIRFKSDQFHTDKAWLSW